ncbi:MAG: hypothetical protein CSB55_02440 [Candidatus Cloacimonadota bacterium]|nr:MAG: hypothetical protein CSB55_02440 [Candidatus Cloacimonadota bacterium]
MKYKILILTVLLSVFLTLKAENQAIRSEISEKYKKAYDEALNLRGEKLKNKLHHLIIHKKKYVYYTDDADTTIGSIIKDLDKDNSKEGNIILFYTGRSQAWKWRDQGWDVDYKDYPIPYENTWNREHIWVKSHGFPNLADTAFTDLHHIRPADRTVNGDRGTRDYDWGGRKHPEAEGAYYDYDSFEPADDIKGDVARMIFYMAVRYEGDNNTYDLEISDSTGTYGERLGKLNTLLEWNALDPVSAREIIRNNKIDKLYQRNRNPFIDHPEFAEMIWGKVKKNPILRVSDKEVKFYEEEINSGSAVNQIVITAINAENSELTVTCPENFSVKTANSENFSSRLTLSDLKRERNHVLDIKFTPVKEGVLNDEMLISDGKDFNFKVNLFGIGIPAGSKIIIEEDFDREPENWEKISLSGQPGWVHSSYGNNYFMKAKGFRKKQPAEYWLISPEIDLSKTKNPFFSFENAKNHHDIKPGLDVFILSNYDKNILEKSDKRKISVNLSDGKWKMVFSGLLDLSEYKNEKIRIAFRYTCSSPQKAESWEVDRFRVFGE